MGMVHGGMVGWLRVVLKGRQCDVVINMKMGETLKRAGNDGCGDGSPITTKHCCAQVMRADNLVDPLLHGPSLMFQLIPTAGCALP